MSGKLYVMPSYIEIEEFLKLARSHAVIDVRSPAEFSQGHLPGAINLPLFDDEQRAEIGTLYKQQGRQQSLLRGLDLVAPNMRALAESGLQSASDKPVLVHCWRGGMRSRSVAWLLEQVDLQTYVLQGGYKSFRRWALESFKQPLPLVVLSGLTGSGKTGQLRQLACSDEQIIDLEQIANHRGSAFGGIGQAAQPTNEQFENELALKLFEIDLTRRVWVEDESRNVGLNRIPHHFFDQLRIAPAVFLQVDNAVRSGLIERDYGDLELVELESAIERITKRLGGQNKKLAIEHLHSGRMRQCIEILLAYYDKLYLANKDKLPRETFVNFETDQPESADTSRAIIQLAETLEPMTATAASTPTAR